MNLGLTDALNNTLDRGRIGVFVGAGISTIPPSNLPTWYKLNRAILQAIHNQAQKNGQVWEPLVSELEERIETSMLPDIYLSQVIVNRIGYQYFRVLKCLNSDEPNSIHYWLADMAKQKRLSVIITSNFDELIEIAFERLGVAYLRCVTEEEFTKANEGLRNNDGTTYLLKIHGSLGYEDSDLIDTLAQRLKGIPPSISRALETVFIEFPFFFMGTSGGDLQAGDDYLHIRRSSGPSLEFYWLFLDEAGVSNNVRELIAFARDKGSNAHVVIGRLPDDLFGRISYHTNELALIAYSNNIHSAAGRMVASSEFLSVVEQWGQEIGSKVASLILADYADHIGRWDIGAKALETILTQNIEFKHTPSVLLRLAELLAKAADRTSWHRALRYLRKAEKLSLFAEEQGEINQARGKVLARLFYFDDAFHAFSIASKEFDKSDRPAQYLTALVKKAECLQSLGRWDQAVREYNEVANLAKMLGYPLEAGRALHRMTEVLRYLDPRDIHNVHDNAKKLFEQVGAIGDLAELAHLKSKIAADQKDWDSVISNAIHSIDLYRISKDPEEEAGVHALLAEALHRQGKKVAARAEMERAEVVAAQTSNERLVKTISNKTSRLWNQIASGKTRIVFAPETPEEEGAFSPESRWKFFVRKALLAAEQQRHSDSFSWMARAALEVPRLEEPTRTQRRVGQELHFGMLLNNGNNPESALQHFISARHLLEKIGDKETLVQAIANQADAFRRNHEDDKALETYAEGLQLAKSIEKPTGSLRPQMKHYSALILHDQGKMPEALRLFHEVIEDEEIKLVPGFHLNALCRLINCLLDVSRINEAKNLLSYTTVFLARLTATTRDIGLTKDARILNSTARVYLSEGNQEMARKTLAEAAKKAGGFFSLQKDPESLADTYSLLGQMSQKKRPYEALRWLGKASELWDEMRIPNKRSHALLAIAETYSEVGRMEEAEEALAESEEIFKSYQNTFGLCCCFLTRAKIAVQNGDFDKAHAMAHEAIIRLPDRDIVQAGEANAIIDDTLSVTFEKLMPREVLRLESNNRRLVLWYGEIEHAIYSSLHAYNGIFLLGRTSQYQEFKSHPMIRKLHHVSKWSVLRQIEEICRIEGWHKVACMPFGGANNSYLVDWIQQPGRTIELHIYYIEPEDYTDIGAFVT